MVKKNGNGINPRHSNCGGRVPLLKQTETSWYPSPNLKSGEPSLCTHVFGIHVLGPWRAPTRTRHAPGVAEGHRRVSPGAAGVGAAGDSRRKSQLAGSWGGFCVFFFWGGLFQVGWGGLEGACWVVYLLGFCGVVLVRLECFDGLGFGASFFFGVGG